MKRSPLLLLMAALATASCADSPTAPAWTVPPQPPRPTRALIDSLKARPLVDVHPPHFPLDPVKR